MAEERTPQQNFEDKLTSSGLTIDDAKLLGLELLTAADTKALSSTFLGLQSMKLNYYDTGG